MSGLLAAVCCLSVVLGLLTFVFLTIPWVDYFSRRLNLNPFRYWDWCERKQKAMDETRRGK